MPARINVRQSVPFIMRLLLEINCTFNRLLPVKKPRMFCFPLFIFCDPILSYTLPSSCFRNLFVFS